VLQVTVTDLPLDLAIVTLGFSNTSSALGPLPLDLVLFGMPGCTAYTSVDAAVLVGGSGGAAAWLLPIPNLPALAGLRFHQQALVPDPGASNAAGAVVSDGATAVVGS
jgi:hypothetical protein